jgi:retron-type reverse transcriptase
MMNGAKKSDSLIVPAKPANKAGHPAAELVEGSSGTKRNAKLQSTVRTQSREAVSQAQDRIRGAVTRGKKEKLTALLHHITVDVLRQAFFTLKKRAAPGVDGVTWVDYAADLDRNLTDLHARVHRGAYRALPSRRRYIPKADGTQRPLGIAAIEDKIVQAAVVAILTPVYEAEFLGFSYGFRPGRSQHDALDALAYGIKARKINWILDADISRFFDSLSPDWLVRFVEHRIGDQRIIRLIQKWLKAGVLEEGRLIETTEGTPQGSGASPLLANVYLHYVYDLWVQQWRKRHATGEMIVVRYADDVRHITRCWIPFAERRGLEDMTLGPTAYPAAKVKGDRSMPSKRERSEDADDPVPQGPRDTVRTELFEPQSPAMQAYIPRHSVLRRGHCDRAAISSSLEPSTRWAMGHRPIQGGERGTSVALDTSSTAGMWDRPTRREAQGDGAAVVLRGRESRPHGEGRQVS